MKTLTIAGRVGKDAVLRHTQNHEPVLGWTVAVNDGYGENKSTLWIDCTLWGKRGPSLEPYIKKGDPITASGELGTREHEGKTYITLRVNEVELQGSGKGEAKPEQKQDGGGGGSGGRPGRELDDEIPFAPEFR